MDQIRDVSDGLVVHLFNFNIELILVFPADCNRQRQRIVPVAFPPFQCRWQNEKVCRVKHPFRCLLYGQRGRVTVL